MPPVDVLRSIMLQLLAGALSGLVWAWVLTLNAALEAERGTHVADAGSAGAGVATVLLVLSGWHVLVPIQHWLLLVFQPCASLLLVVLLLLSWSLWIGFFLGTAIGACQHPAEAHPPRRFGFRRRR